MEKNSMVENKSPTMHFYGKQPHINLSFNQKHYSRKVFVGSQFFLVLSIHPIAKHISNACRWINSRTYLDDGPYRTSKLALEEQVLDCLVIMTEDTLFTFMPIAFCNVVFSKNNPPTKIPHKNFVF